MTTIVPIRLHNAVHYFDRNEESNSSNQKIKYVILNTFKDSEKNPYTICGIRQKGGGWGEIKPE